MEAFGTEKTVGRFGPSLPSTRIWPSPTHPMIAIRAAKGSGKTKALTRWTAKDEKF